MTAIKDGTIDQVFSELTADTWARTKLVEIHRKFAVREAELRVAADSPDHFIYATPEKARAEINELASWIRERFGDPANAVPAKTPFGYLSDKYDGWITLFAASIFDDGLTCFIATIGKMSWAVAEARQEARRP